MTFNGMKWRFKEKIRRFPSGCLAGLAGNVDVGLKLLDWLENDDLDAELVLPEGTEADEAEALLITPDGGVTIYDALGYAAYVEDKVCAVGSGALLATGAMLAGKTAVEAVKIAIERDPFSGFEVVSYALGT